MIEILDKRKPVAKNRLLAKRVSRIALVDRGAVPGAVMVAYKRKTDDLQKSRNWDGEAIVNLIKEKKFSEVTNELGKGYYGPDADFNVAFIYKGINASISALSGVIWDAIYMSEDENVNKKDMIDKAISDFEILILETFVKLGMKNKEETPTKLTVEEVTQSVERQLGLTAIGEAFYTLGSVITYVVMEQSRFEDVDATIKGIITALKSFIFKNIESVINKSFSELKEETPIFEKVGRIISSGRLKELKESAMILNRIINEVDDKYNNIEENKKLESEDDMKNLDELNTMVQGVVDVLKSQGHLLTEEEKTEFNKKKEEELQKQKDEDLKKQEDDAKIEAELSKKKEEEEILARKAIEEEKQWKDEVNKSLEIVSEISKEFNSLKENLNKRLGVSTSLGMEIVDKANVYIDHFAEGLK